MASRMTQPGKGPHPRPARRQPAVHLLALAILLVGCATGLAEAPNAESFLDRVQPVLDEHCLSCHDDIQKKGRLSFEGMEADASRLANRDLWWGVLKNVRAGIMPPVSQPRLDGKSQRALEDWIKFQAFGIDPGDLDPGRVTVRRLNRIEYRNTIRDLLGVVYDTNAEFPPDDAGHGFDNIGDVLTMSPLLLEKYIAAANSVITKVVPMAPKAVVDKVLPGDSFHHSGTGKGPAPPRKNPSALSLSYYKEATAAHVSGGALGTLPPHPRSDGHGVLRRRRLRLQPVPDHLQGGRSRAATARAEPAGQ